MDDLLHRGVPDPGDAVIPLGGREQHTIGVVLQRHDGPAHPWAARQVVGPDLGQLRPGVHLGQGHSVHAEPDGQRRPVRRVGQILGAVAADECVDPATVGELVDEGGPCTDRQVDAVRVGSHHVHGSLELRTPQQFGLARHHGLLGRLPGFLERFRCRFRFLGNCHTPQGDTSSSHERDLRRRRTEMEVPPRCR